MIVAVACLPLASVGVAAQPAPAAAAPASAPPAPRAATATQPAEFTARDFDLQRPEVAQFVAQVVDHDGLSRQSVEALLRQAQPQPKILEIMTRPLEHITPWWEYRERFLTPERVSLGAQFWFDHRLTLEEVSAKYQVSPEYVVAIIGVESFYGRVTCKYRVLDALATLAFDYPPRAAYFTSELEQFLLLTRDSGLDPLTTCGSYAGAMGVLQFMPSVFRRYAVNASPGKRPDLWTDWDDILASVANYLHEFGWVPGGPVLSDTTLDPDPSFQIEPRNLDLNQTVASLAAEGVKVDLDVPADTRVVLVSAEQRDGPAYRVGFENFYVITRYNHSARYAMAVYDLAQAIAARVHEASK